MNRADREQIEVFKEYLMRVDWHLLVARYSEAEIRRLIDLGDKMEAEGGADRNIASFKKAA